MANTCPGGAVLPHIVAQHCEEAAHLLLQRWRMVLSPDAHLRTLGRLDERIAAHVDGLRVAGDVGLTLAHGAAVEQSIPGAGTFAAAVLTLEAGDQQGFLALGGEEALPPVQAALRSALGWVSAPSLRGTVSALLRSAQPFQVRLGLAACVAHRVDPGPLLAGTLAAPDPGLRSCALRAAGESGRRDLLAQCVSALADPDPGCRLSALRSVALLGERARSGGVLMQEDWRTPGARATLEVVLKIVSAEHANSILKTLALDHPDERLVVRGAGISGDPRYVPWLLGKIQQAQLARVAGEAFSLFTGADIALLGCQPSAGFQSGPTDNPDDDNVDMDEDDGLPWPDPAKLQAWWEVNQHAFQPGVRYFMGAPVTVEHCRKVLREGYQRQRVAAAEYLCLLQPGTPLFPTSAPAWRQQRWLKQMG